MTNIHKVITKKEFIAGGIMRPETVILKVEDALGRRLTATERSEYHSAHLSGGLTTFVEGDTKIEVMIS
jgi:hypothetical protein